MRQIYFCNPEKSKELLSEIDKSVEYECLIYENYCLVDFSVFKHDVLDEKLSYVMDHGSIGDPIYVRIHDGWHDASLNGYCSFPLFYDLARILSFKNEFVEKLKLIYSPSCPLAIIDTVNHDEDEAIKEMIGNSEVSDDEW